MWTSGWPSLDAGPFRSVGFSSVCVCVCVTVVVAAAGSRCPRGVQGPLDLSRSLAAVADHHAVDCLVFTSYNRLDILMRGQADVVTAAAPAAAATAAVVSQWSLYVVVCGRP